MWIMVSRNTIATEDSFVKENKNVDKEENEENGVKDVVKCKLIFFYSFQILD